MQVAIGAIITRAVAASAKGGELLLQVRPAQAGVEILVADQGEALPAERLHCFFDPLTNERINPVSLGLALGRRIVELHGGEVAAEAGAPAGTRVRVTIPID
jgi:signal transduction histidine kinase